jgi:hypothetical protein
LQLFLKNTESVVFMKYIANNSVQKQILEGMESISKKYLISAKIKSYAFLLDDKCDGGMIKAWSNELCFDKAFFLIYTVLGI